MEKIGSRCALFHFFLEKWETLFDFLKYKNRNAYQFNVFAMKSDLENMSESGEFRFENSLKVDLESRSMTQNFLAHFLSQF